MAIDTQAAPRRMEIPRIVYAIWGIFAAGYVLLGLFMWRLGFQFMRDDTVLYWQDSFDWKAAFNGLYAPLYLWVLAITRTLSFGLIPAILLMMAINLACLLACGWLIYRIGLATGVSAELSAAGATLFALWPLIGLTYTVYPKTDIPSLAIYLGGVYLLLTDRYRAGSAVIGIAMLSHEVLWPLGPLTIAAWWLSDRARFGWRGLLVGMFLCLLPLGLLLLAGAVIKGSISWPLSESARHVVTYGYAPVLDGAIGTFLRGGLAEIAKGLIVAGIAVLAGILGFICTRQKPAGYPIGVAICVLMIALWLVLNSFDIWGLVRFSRLLALPLMWVGAGRIKGNLFATRQGQIGAAVVLAGLLISQFVYGWYMVKVFYIP